MTRRIIGLVGRIASGKTIVADYLVRERGMMYYRFSDVLKDILGRLHMPNDRQNLQNLGLGLRRAFGEGVLAAALRRDIQEGPEGDIVVDGIRYPEEYEMVREMGGTVIYVTAPVEVRYARAVGRGTRGEGGMNLEEFKKGEEKETERLIDQLGEKADLTLTNTGTIDELKRKVEEALKSK
jgi:dephospho-CoA kinase